MVILLSGSLNLKKLENEQTTRGFTASRRDDGIQSCVCAKSGEWRAEQQDNKRCFDRHQCSKAKCGEDSSKAKEREKFIVSECDLGCTDEDKIHGMFGYFCTRCGESDLGSLNDH
ncbi:hypothetical protein VB796_21170 [Arcicella sp. LKC2W]|uniref:hypothetical protein n=1 Tax=Arcicella sp. LKC2W TaxID=2984198 RepID=UPI002B1FD51F|nr:hypothetical protein [Arcicella sp. LKC2W]MEA5461592.1 hypothetical protein [Arcicella sp. LKC2W]